MALKQRKSNKVKRKSNKRKNKIPSPRKPNRIKNSRTIKKKKFIKPLQFQIVLKRNLINSPIISRTNHQAVRARAPNFKIKVILIRKTLESSKIN